MRLSARGEEEKVNRGRYLFKRKRTGGGKVQGLRSKEATVEVE